MARNPLDDATAARLLAGRLAPQDAPPGYAGVAALVRTAAGPPTVAELAGEAIVVGAAVAVLGTAGPGRQLSPRSSRWARALTAKLAAVALVTVAGATAAAAAAGSLPAPAQTVVSDAASHLGISVPEPDHHVPASSTGATTGRGGAASATAAGVGQGTNDPNTFGQCTAFLAGPGSGTGSPSSAPAASGKDASTAFKDFIAEHGGTAAATTSYCTNFIATPAGDHGQASTSGAPAGTTGASTSGGTSHPGKPSDGPGSTPTTHPAGIGGHGEGTTPSSTPPSGGTRSGGNGGHP